MRNRVVPQPLCSRDERYELGPDVLLSVQVQWGKHLRQGRVRDLSPSGALLDLDGPVPVGEAVVVVLSVLEEEPLELEGKVTRAESEQPNLLAVAFAQRLRLETLEGVLSARSYVRGELSCRPNPEEGEKKPKMCYVTDFFRVSSRDLFAKCRAFHQLADRLQQARMYQALYRVTLTTGLDHRAVVFNPVTRREEVMACFDSNSYLGLHLHPRVVGAAREVLGKVGYGTPSAQVLGGTSRYLRELEAKLCEFHGRQDAIVFPSGYAANQGLITALLREKDLIVRDQFSHASIHDGALMCLAGNKRTYPHGDLAALERILREAAVDTQLEGRLIATDGVFSMHGAVADLPGLVDIARRHGAKLLVDEAHATGVYGPNGGGLEELYSMPGSIDLLMGTFSKAPGTIGGYVCASTEVVSYLRFFARSGLFTAALPAHLCAGVTEAFRVMQSEPEHRERLWENTRWLHQSLKQAGLPVQETVSPIVTVFSGVTPMLWSLAAQLFASNVKVGTVDFPAVAKGETILRITVNARHTMEDLQQLTDALVRAYKSHGLLGKSREEIREIGRTLEN